MYTRIKNYFRKFFSGRDGKLNAVGLGAWALGTAFMFPFMISKQSENEKVCMLTRRGHGDPDADAQDAGQP